MLLSIMVMFWFWINMAILLLCFKIISPISMTLLLLMFCLSLAKFLSTFLSLWIPLTLIVMFMGGMMVMFIYTSSLVSSEKLLTPNVDFLFLFAISSMFILSVGMPKDMWTLPLTSVPNHSLSIMFELYGYENLIFSTLYILITMLMIVKMVQIFKGPLKWKF